MSGLNFNKKVFLTDLKISEDLIRAANANMNFDEFRYPVKFLNDKSEEIRTIGWDEGLVLLGCEVEILPSGNWRINSHWLPLQWEIITCQAFTTMRPGTKEATLASSRPNGLIKGCVN